MDMILARFRFMNLDTGAAAFKAEESKMSDTVLQIMQPTNPVEPPYQYMMIDGCKVKVNYLPKPPAPSACKVLDRIHEILLASRLKKYPPHICIFVTSMQ